MSVISRSGCSARKRSNASTPSPASMSLCPPLARSSIRNSRASASSSATRIFPAMNTRPLLSVLELSAERRPLSICRAMSNYREAKRFLRYSVNRCIGQTPKAGSSRQYGNRLSTRLADVTGAPLATGQCPGALRGAVQRTSRVLKNVFNTLLIGPRMAQRNHGQFHVRDFGSAAKTTLFASDVEKGHGWTFSAT